MDKKKETHSLPNEVPLTAEELIKNQKEEKKARELKRRERLKLASYCPKKPGQSWSYLSK